MGKYKESPFEEEREINMREKREYLEEKLRESGEEKRLEDYLRKKLIESGWKNELKNHCKLLIKQKGLEKININSLVDELAVKGQSLVPIQLKEDLLSKIKFYFEDEGL